MFKPQYKQLSNVNGIEIKPSDVHESWSIAAASLSAIAFHFSQLLKCDTDMVASYRSTLLAMLLWLANYKQCSIRLLNMLHKCNTDVFGVHLHSPLWDRAYISVKPLAAVLQPING